MIHRPLTIPSAALGGGHGRIAPPGSANGTVTVNCLFREEPYQATKTNCVEELGVDIASK